MLAKGETTLRPEPHSGDWLDADELKSLTVEEIVHRITSLQGMISANANESERIRKPVDEVWAALRKTGVFYLHIPKERGGLEQGLQAFIDVIVPIAEVDTALAWNVCFVVFHQWMMPQFPKELQDEVWGSLPYFTSAGSAWPPGKIEKVEGGYRLSGRYKYGSGIMHSEWTTPIAMMQLEDGTQAPIISFVPVEDVTVYDTWQMDGMAGTGSHDISYSDVFIPDHRALPLAKLIQGQHHHANPFYRMSMTPFFTLVPATPMLGAARGAVKLFRQKLLTPGPEGTVTEKPVLQHALAKADLTLISAEATLRDAARQAEELVAGDQPLSGEDRIRLRAQISFAARQCLEAVRIIADLAGSSAHRSTNPLQRIVRDVNVIATHGTLEFNASVELYGQALTGLSSHYLYT